ncbi:MAG TPA: DNA-processing protein DprA [Patescibacteria group bacterium]|nr:DNA-processing protein DprA [Patescibacteria group bacterium]
MEENYILGFSNAIGVGPKGFQNLLKVYGSAELAWKEPLEEKYKSAGIGKINYSKFVEFQKTFNISEYLEKLKKTKVEFIPYSAKFYPKKLADIDSPPIGLYIKGNKNLLIESNLLGIVGARKTTTYGIEATISLTNELSDSFVIVSGLALGIDATAHKTTLENHGRTIAVLGCGVDCPYPRENENLYEEILDYGGLIISEYPLGMKASAGTFPARNRVIAGISEAVLVTEAAVDSGSLITADYAIKQGKTVFAVPGPINSKMSDGTAKLLKNGAVLVTSAQDIFDNLNLKNQAPNSKQRLNPKLQNLKLSKEENKIVEVLNEEKSIDQIVRETKIPMHKLSIILSEMELKGIIKNSGGKINLIFI